MNGIEGLETVYAAGYAAGYNKRVAEENADYPPRPFGIVEGEAGLIIDGVRIRRQTVKERRAADRATLEEAHAADLHVGFRATGCPECFPGDVESQKQHNGHYGVHPTCIDVSTIAEGRGTTYACGPECPSPCADGCSDLAAHAEGAHDV